MIRDWPNLVQRVLLQLKSDNRKIDNRKPIHRMITKTVSNGQLKIAKYGAMIVKSLLRTSQGIQSIRQVPICNSSLGLSTVHQQWVQVRLAYSFSRLVQSPQKPKQLSTSQMVSQSLQPQSVIDVNGAKSTMLFMDSNRLASLVRMNRIKNSLQGCQVQSYKDQSYDNGIISGQSIFVTGADDKIQLSQFNQFDRKILSITQYNQYLSKAVFDDYKDYPIIKLTQICLKFIHEHHRQPHSTLYTQNKTPLQHWKSLENFIRKRMHNCSVKDYIKIVFISLNAYHSIYKFNLPFIESLISGLRKEIPLMEEQQLMQLFLAVSQPFMDQRPHWENSLRFSYSNFGLKNTNYRIKSPFYQNGILYSLHHEVLQKILKRYQNKFMNTELAIKEQELFKLLWWSQTIIAFRNESIGHIRDNGYSNLSKNKFLVGIVNVLTSKLHPTLKKNMTHVIKGQVRQIQNKQIGFKSVGEMIRFFECLGILRDFLREEGENGLVYEGIDEKAKEVRLRASTWIEKSIQVNDIIKSVLNYQSVKDLINSLLSPNTQAQMTLGKVKEQLQKQNDEQNKNQIKPSVNDYQKMWKLIEIMDESWRHGKENVLSNSKDWYIQAVNNFRVFELMEKTREAVECSINRWQLNQKLQTSWLRDEERLMKLGQCQLNVFYELFNNLTNINRQFHLRKALQSIQALSNVNLSQLYSGIISTCFYSNKLPEQFIGMTNQITNQTTHRLMDIVSPKTVQKIINLEISISRMNEINGKQSSMSAVGLVISYAEQMIGRSHSPHSQFHFLYYIRQLDFLIYNYLSIYINTFSQSHSTITLKAKQIVNFLLNRNTLAQKYLRQNHLQYQQSLNTQKHNVFLANYKYISTNNYNALVSNHGLTAQKPKLNEGDFLYSKNNQLMGEFVMKCVEDEKRRMLMDQNIVRLNKFFTEIKAFKEIRFCYPITPFLVCPQFLFLLDNLNREKHNQNNTQPVKGIYFLPKDIIMQTQLLSLKQMYLIHGIELAVIEVNEFLDMHINERIQALNRAIFGSMSPCATNNRSNVPRIEEEIISKLC